jgi:hypothetical protein
MRENGAYDQGGGDHERGGAGSSRVSRGRMGTLCQTRSRVRGTYVRRRRLRPVARRPERETEKEPAMAAGSEGAFTAETSNTTSVAVWQVGGPRARSAASSGCEPDECDGCGSRDCGRFERCESER